MTFIHAEGPSADRFGTRESMECLWVWTCRQSGLHGLDAVLSHPNYRSASSQNRTRSRVGILRRLPLSESPTLSSARLASTASDCSQSDVEQSTALAPRNIPTPLRPAVRAVCRPPRARSHFRSRARALSSWLPATAGTHTVREPCPSPCQPGRP